VLGEGERWSVMAKAMEAIKRALQAMMMREALCIVLMSVFYRLMMADQLPNCSFPIVYTFGDFLTINKNAIAMFLEQFMDSITWPNSVLALRYCAGRYYDGGFLRTT
jgi:hypothetical protein